MPDVSVIIIARNVRDELLECLESVRTWSDGLSLQVIVVDNGSTDGTASAVRDRYADAEIVELTTNEGDPARNHGLRRARGRARMFLDSDARLTAGALRTLLHALDGSPRTGLVAPQLIYPDGSPQMNVRRFPPLLLPVLRRPPLGRFFERRRAVRRHLMVDDDHRARRRVEYAISACVLFSAAAHSAAGELDEAIWWGWIDADWCLQIREAGFDVEFVPEARVIHGYRRTTAKSPFTYMALKQLQAHFYFQRKWWSRRRRLIREGREMDVDARVRARHAIGEPDAV